MAVQTGFSPRGAGEKKSEWAKPQSCRLGSSQAKGARIDIRTRGSSLVENPRTGVPQGEVQYSTILRDEMSLPDKKQTRCCCPRLRGGRAETGLHTSLSFVVQEYKLRSGSTIGGLEKARSQRSGKQDGQYLILSLPRVANVPEWMHWSSE